MTNQVQTLTAKLLTPFSAHNINMEAFFQDVAEKTKHYKVLESLNSTLLPRSDIKEWLLSQLPYKVVTLTLLFRGSTHGWSRDKFHQLCDNKGPTIAIYKSKAQRVFGSFTLESWDSKSYYKKDEKAFIFSIDRKQIYRVLKAQYAIFCHSNWGSSFGGDALGLYGDPLNKEDAGRCYTNGYGDGASYGIKSDSEGNHEVTGEGHKQKDDDGKYFTCEQLEVYGVTLQQ